MTIYSVFTQLNQAYLLVDLSDWSIPVVNARAATMLRQTEKELESSDLWQSRLKPLLQARTSESDLVFHIDSAIYQARCSEISAEEHRFLAINLIPFLSSTSHQRDVFALLDNLGAYVYCKDVNYNYTYANRQVCDLFGYPLEEIIGESDARFFGAETAKSLVEGSDRYVIEDGDIIEKEEINYVPGLDEYRHYLTVKKPLHNEHGEIIGLFGISTDVTALKVAERRLRDSETKLSTILDNVGAYVYIKDSERRFRYINKKTEELFGLSSEKILGMNNYELLGDIQGEEFDHTDRQVFETGRRMACIETFNAGDETYYYWSVKIPLENDDGEVDRYIGMSMDITEQKKLEYQVREANRTLKEKIREISQLRDELHDQAIRDALTGLYNRRFMEDKVEQTFGDRRVGACTLMMIDVDHFKKVNDELGHKKGDQVLQLLATLMQDECRAEDMVCRYGGEEFLILLPATDIHVSFRKAEWIRKRYEVLVAETYSEAAGSTISIGLASSPDHGSDFANVYQCADKALYRAKSMGRNCSVMAYI
ncbi:diguanylate cyclase [Pontibacterium sp.]|uniref:sensor domain-containing diguanylate cyclase n=1 Tax=Pontibacterium sp. TaxID=2036026 RepID=UPI00356207D9